jgi:hypothetical protein
MEEYSDSYSTDGDGPVLSELAAYGGHLNRFTFLKVRCDCYSLKLYGTITNAHHCLLLLY